MEVEETNNSVEVSEENTKNRETFTPEEIEEILKIANIDKEQVAPVIQTLYSSVPLDKQNDEYRIIEIDDHLLESLKIGDCLSFRGDEDEPIVLCSGTRTYEIKEAETSNSCLYIPNLKCKDEVVVEGAEGLIVEEKDVQFFFNKYFELKECRPKLDKILDILRPSSFKGLEYEKTVDPLTLYDWNRLQSELQASDGEIKEALPEYLVACVDDHYRLIAFEFEARALPLMLDLIEENSWEIDEIDKEISYESLQEIIPEPVFELLFKKYTVKSTKTKKDGTQLYKYDVAKASRLLAHILLTACPSNNYDDFMEAWKIGSPDTIEPKEEYLYGIAVVRYNKQNMRKEVILYPESSLPDNLHKRLSELFVTKEKWTLHEITPYISKFTTRNQDVNAILTKFTRSSTSNGIKYYSAKHGK